jgi:hypothetical protein
MLTCYTLILDVPGSSLGRATDCLELSVIFRQMPAQCLEIGHDRLVLNTYLLSINDNVP